MSQGAIIERKGKRGTSYLLKYDGGRDPATGKRRQLYATVRGTKKAAERELRRLLGQLDEGTHVDPQKMTLAQWVESWLSSTRPKVSAKTYERYAELLRLHVAPYIGQLPVQRIAAYDIEGLYTKLRADGRRRPKSQRTLEERQTDAPLGGLSERTLLHVHRVLSRMLLIAARQRVIVRNPLDDVEAPRPEAGQAAESGEDGTGEAVQALERPRLVELLQGLREEWLFPVAAVAAATGARRGEILALRWSDVDLEAGAIRIERSVEETNTSGVRIKAPKNRSSKRTIGIDAGLVGLLRGHKAHQAEAALALGTRPENDWLVFPQTAAEPLAPIRPRNVSKRFSILARRLGFQGFRFHDLRHTHATLLLSAGVPVNAVAQRLGHSTPVITLKVYGHVLRRSEDQAVAVSGGMIAGALLGG